MYTFSQKRKEKMAFQNGSSRNIVSPKGYKKQRPLY
jgi:hypothetical protein